MKAKNNLEQTINDTFVRKNYGGQSVLPFDSMANNISWWLKGVATKEDCEDAIMDKFMHSLETGDVNVTGRQIRNRANSAAKVGAYNRMGRLQNGKTPKHTRTVIVGQDREVVEAYGIHNGQVVLGNYKLTDECNH